MMCVTVRHTLILEYLFLKPVCRLVMTLLEMFLTPVMFMMRLVVYLSRFLLRPRK